MIGLRHPEDLAAWQQWQRRGKFAQRIMHVARRNPDVIGTVLNVPADGEPNLMLAVDITTGPKLETLLAPARAVGLGRVATLSPASIAATLGPGRREILLPAHATASELLRVSPQLAAVRAGLSYGHYLRMGHLINQWAPELDWAQVVLQHGLLTPFQPPLPPHARLLAWSGADADFWASGREDVTTSVVGSQLLAEAAAHPAIPAQREGAPTYLGQLHGAELPRRGMAHAASSFCRAHHATYRPHPSESDKLSRLQHTAWERRGISIDRSGSPLREHDGLVVAAFSTGVLEAAARGVPAFVHYPEPPGWLEEFWERYDMRAWGGPPTPAPWTGADPAAAILAAVLDVIGRTSG